MKKSIEMKNSLKTLKAEASAMLGMDNVTAEQLNAKADEISKLEAQIAIQEKLEADEELEMQNKIDNGLGGKIEAAPVINEEAEYKKAFYNVITGKAITPDQENLIRKFNNALSSTTPADGGYLIPVDQMTAIKLLKREMRAAEFLVNVEPVSTLTGSRNIEKNALYTSFAEFAEGDDVPASDTPQFVNITYSIKDRGGILPVPNNLLADNTAGLEGYLNRWLAMKNVATINKLVFDLLATKSKTALANADAIKGAINITLDPAIAAGSKIITNQTGFNYLDTLKDNDGRYLLQPMVTDPTKKMLFGLEVVVFSNKTLANDTTSGTKAPIIIGDLKEAVTLFDRQAMSILATNIGGTAFTKNQTQIRAIEREDIKLVDSDAFIYGQVTIA